MSLIHTKVTGARGTALTTLTMLTMLGALFVAASTVSALPQATTASPSVAPRATTSRVRCVGCNDSTRANYEMLLTRLDSLRWQFSNRRLTEAEQEVFSREMAATIMALQHFMERSGARMQLAPTPRAEAAAGVVVGGDGYTFTVQRSRRGYLGITFDGPSYGYPPERPDVIRFIQYPKIASVDPASPAERAGLIMGDTLMAMNGTDVVEHSITLSKILVPDEKVMLRVRRDGDAKEFRVVVGEAPAYVARRVMPPQPDVVTIVPVPPATGAPPVRAEVRARVGRAEAPLPPAMATPWEGPVQGRAFVFSAAVAGARVETLSEGLGKAFGVKEGVLVMQAPPGSPAYVSGLRDGDVIISAAGAVVTTARQLSGTVMNADRENGVKIVILRDKKKQDLTLRWK